MEYFDKVNLTVEQYVGVRGKLLVIFAWWECMRRLKSHTRAARGRTEHTAKWFQLDVDFPARGKAYSAIQMCKLCIFKQHCEDEVVCEAFPHIKKCTSSGSCCTDR